VNPSLAIHVTFIDLLKRIFVYDPNRRLTAREALKHPFFGEVAEDEGTQVARQK